MTPQVQKLFDEARQLPPKDRVALAEQLFESVDDEELEDDLGADLEYQEEWAEEIKRRVEELESGAVKTIPWEEVRRKMLQQAEDADAD